MKANEIRQSFLDFFKSKNHKIVPSAPVVPQNDPTLLFTNAGMNQFKDIFLGTQAPDAPRAADSQKCIRVSGKHNDLEEVGRDTYHHTFFEMLGNWSFGDYFKSEAIEWAWELLTDVWELPKDRLYATVFEGDQDDHVAKDTEAIKEWKSKTDIDHSHILEFDKKDNFWEMGNTGPCGPCSEIHIDRGSEFCDSDDPDHVCEVNSGCARFIELWNLVFIQYNRDESGKLHPLPAKHVDTGAGFERLVAVMQHVKSNYDTDVFTPLLKRIGELAGKPYTDGEQAVAFRVISDHVRALTFAITDGVIPGNEGRGYVVRRILRRAARFGRLLEMREPFIYKLVGTLCDQMGETYPELRERHDYVKRVIRSEEESFGRTLDRGIEIFEDRSRQLAERGVTVFPGKDAFELHDTYGFPLDLTQLMAEEKQLTVDVKAFNREMDAQRQRSAQAAKNVNYQTIDVQAEPTQFLGYDKDETDASVIKYIDGKLVLSRTPFYAESGGQVGDIGVIKGDDFEFQVTDTQKAGEHVLHIGELKSGQPKPGDRATAVIDRDRRRATERNHTVTHLVHRALRMTLGEHVQQAGSLVGPETMRFDFTHFEALTAEQRHQVETIVNEQILKNRKTTWSYTDIETAKADGAVALFGEKYGDEVRVVEVENYSKELCGGTHVRATGEIGSFVIINESSVAAGIRRIECLTGMQALNYLENGRKVAQRSSRLLGCTPEQLESCVQALIDEQKEIQNELKTLRQQSSKGEIDTILDQIKQVNGIQVVAGEVHANEANDMRKLGDHVRNGLDSGVGVLGAAIDDKVSLVCVVTDDLVKKGVKAGDIIKKVASYVQGGGGGAPHMALAGGKDVSKLPLALSKVEQIVNECRN